MVSLSLTHTHTRTQHTQARIYSHTRSHIYVHTQRHKYTQQDYDHKQIHTPTHTHAGDIMKPHTPHTALPADSADLTLSRLDKLRNANGNLRTAEIRRSMQKIMQNNAAVFRTQVSEGVRAWLRSFHGHGQYNVSNLFGYAWCSCLKGMSHRSPAHRCGLAVSLC